MFANLSIHPLVIIGRFIQDFKTLVAFRHTCKYIYELTEREEMIWQEARNHFVLVLEEDSLVDEFFDYLNEQQQQKRSVFCETLLHVVMTGSVVMIEECGFIQCRYTIDRFFKSLFHNCCIHNNNHSNNHSNNQVNLNDKKGQVVVNVKGMMNEMYLREMAYRSDFWHCIDDLWRVFPRDTLLDLCQQWKQTRDQVNKMSVLAYVIRVLMENGFPLHRMIFLDTMRDFNRDCYPELPKTCFGFTILHFLCFVRDQDAIRSLLTVAYPFNTTNNSEVSRRFDVDKQDRMGRTALCYCALNSSMNDISKLLINEFNANPFLTDVENVSAVMVAQLHENNDLIQFLISKYGSEVIDKHLNQQKQYRLLLAKIESDELEKKKQKLMMQQQQNENDENEDDCDSVVSQFDEIDQFEESDWKELEEDYIGYTEKVPLRDCGYEMKDHHYLFDEDSKYSWASDEDREEQGISSTSLDHSDLSTCTLRGYINKFETEENTHKQHNGFLFPTVKINARKISSLSVNGGDDDLTQNHTATDEDDCRPAKRQKRYHHYSDHHKEEVLVVEEKNMNEQEEQFEKPKVMSRSEMVIPKEYFYHLVKGMISQYLPNAHATPLSKFILQHACEVLLSRLLSEAQHFSDYYLRDYVSPIDMKYAIMKLMTRHCNALPSNMIFTPSIHYALDDPITNPFPDHQFNVHPDDATKYWVERNEELPSLSNDEDCRSDLTSVSSDSCASIIQHVPEHELTNTTTFDNYVFVSVDSTAAAGT